MLSDLSQNLGAILGPSSPPQSVIFKSSFPIKIAHGPPSCPSECPTQWEREQGERPQVKKGKEMRVAFSTLRGILQPSRSQCRISVFAPHALAALLGSLTPSDCLGAALLLPACVWRILSLQRNSNLTSSGHFGSAQAESSLIFLLSSPKWTLLPQLLWAFSLEGVCPGLMAADGICTDDVWLQSVIPFRTLKWLADFLGLSRASVSQLQPLGPHSL